MVLDNTIIRPYIKTLRLIIRYDINESMLAKDDYEHSEFLKFEEISEHRSDAISYLERFVF